MDDSQAAIDSNILLARCMQASAEARRAHDRSLMLRQETLEALQRLSAIRAASTGGSSRSLPRLREPEDHLSDRP